MHYLIHLNQLDFHQYQHFFDNSQQRFLNQFQHQNNLFHKLNLI